MSGKTEEEIKADKEAKAAKKKAEEIKAEKEKLAEEESNKAKEKREKTSFLKEISEKIKTAKSLEDLEALNQRVYDIWSDDVPIEIQELASKRGQEIEDEKPAAKKISNNEDLQKDWVKVTEKELKQAEKDGKLAGYDPLTQTALINE